MSDSRKFAKHRIWRLGSRGSPLALIQTFEARARLAAVHAIDPGRMELVPIRTKGDRIQDRPLADYGGKGLFISELNAALAAGEIDLAVHSAKDLPGSSFDAAMDGSMLAAALPRADCADALISSQACRIEELPCGARVGTASPRRRAQLLRKRPDLCVTLLRGNINTRLAALRDKGRFKAILLAMSGLRRLGIEGGDIHRVDTNDLLPAIGQGTLVLAVRADDAEAKYLPGRRTTRIVGRRFVSSGNSSWNLAVIAIPRSPVLHRS